VEVYLLASGFSAGAPLMMRLAILCTTALLIYIDFVFNAPHARITARRGNWKIIIYFI